MNNSIPFEGNEVIIDEQLALVAGGDAYSAGHTMGEAAAYIYWGARNYLSETVYPYWLD